MQYGLARSDGAQPAHVREGEPVAPVGAVRSYVPRPCGTPQLVIWPADEPAPLARDGLFGWRHLATTVKLEVVPGEHHTIVIEQAPRVVRRNAAALA